ncbi:MAG: hypothetical protein PHN88_16255 [Ignavibacteria bacterium]|nr:hypothetical protein [Ignavibacteria bacterium]
MNRIEWAFGGFSSTGIKKLKAKLFLMNLNNRAERYWFMQAVEYASLSVSPVNRVKIDGAMIMFLELEFTVDDFWYCSSAGSNMTVDEVGETKTNGMAGSCG